MNQGLSGIPFSFLLTLLTFTGVIAQTFQNEALEQGYWQEGDTAYFVFSEKHYQIGTPEQVVVTGSFRNWDGDMSDIQWQLKPVSKQTWALPLANPNLLKIPARAEFKFRINDGQWLEPPQLAPNQNGGNLVFMHDVVPPSLKAELRRPRTIWAEIDGQERSLNPKDYKLTDGQGQEIAIASILPNTRTQTLITPADSLDLRRVYFLEIRETGLKTHCSYDGWFRDVYSNKTLGAEIDPKGRTTSFRVFAPRATGMKLYLYRSAGDQEAYKVVQMQRDKDGVWEAIFQENLKGVYYDFTVHGPKDPGNFFYETHPVHISDPYARVSLDSWGKCRVWEKTKPAPPLEGGRPPMESVIAYEVHLQDFTNQLPVSDDLKGTIPAMVMPGLKNQQGKPVGFDHLLELGINVVHLMPMQEFLHWPDEDWKASFGQDPFMVKHEINQENYQWGYRTTHAFAVESRFAQKGTEPGAQRDQFRDLVAAFHEKGIAVIIDIVPNHTGENMDGQEVLFNFNALDKQYYYRTRNFEHIGAFGNEVKTENRPMVQRWLIDQCRHWIEEFGIDGFRIDLAGQIDQQTLIALRKALGEDIIIYGEPWIGSNDPAYEANSDWDWYKADAPITFFQDDARNAFKGPVSNPSDKRTDRGYAGGDPTQKEKAKLGLINGFPEDKTPLSGINYLDIHDNWALADRFARVNWDGRYGVDEDRFKIAALLLFTSQGPIVLHGGTEIMRSKGLAELKETLKETQKGIKVYLHGKRDTYNMRAANQFVWDNVGLSSQSPESYADYDNMFRFWQGLIHLRRSEAGAIFRNTEALPSTYYQWIETENPRQLGYIIHDKLMVLLNVDEKPNTFPALAFPEGNWRLIGNNTAVNHTLGVSDGTWSELPGGDAYDIPLAPASFKMWIKE